MKPPTLVVSTRLEVGELKRLDQIARQCGMNRSQFLADLIRYHVLYPESPESPKGDSIPGSLARSFLQSSA